MRMTRGERRCCRIPLPIRCRPRFAGPNSAAGRLSTFVAKTLMYIRFSPSEGGFSGAETDFSLSSGRSPDRVGRPAGQFINRQRVVCRCRNCHLLAKNVEQQPDAPGVVQLIQYRELLGEGARHQTHRPGQLQFAGELQNAARVGCRDQRLARFGIPLTPPW